MDWKPNVRRAAPAFVSVAAIAGALYLSIALRDQHADRPATRLPSPVTATGWWVNVTEELTAAEYRVTADPRGSFQAPNRAHDFRTHFRAAIEVEPRRIESGEAWHFSWLTSGLGRRGWMQEVAPAAPEVGGPHGSRVIYRRYGLVEWYENTHAGLEQGFTIEKPPAGIGPVVIEGRIAGALRPVLAKNGAVDFVAADGACALRYGSLAVRDATGLAVESRLAVTADRLAILIEDEGAIYPLAVDPLLTNPLWTAESNQASSEFGLSVATAGDVNGDGFSDILVGARSYDNGLMNQGRVFLYLGSPAGPSASPAWISDGSQANALRGSSVETAGDVNGDGFADVVIGERGYDNGQADEGRALVYLGSAAGLAASPGWTAESNRTGAAFGANVATAGDVNGDGYSDVIVGAFNFDNGQLGEGAAFVYHGGVSGLGASPAWAVESNQSGAAFGIDVATAGDVNGDGFSDVIVGASFYDNIQTNEGRAVVYLGGGGGLASTPSWTAEPNQVDARLGASVASAGDVNGDGFSDVIVGATLYDNVQANEGRVWVYHGSAAGVAASPAWTIEANQASAQLGTSVATAGDVNGDGFADVIVGAPLYEDDATDEGRAWVYEGSAAGLGTTAAWAGDSHQGGGNFGVSVGTAGDVDGDGYSDVIVGAHLVDNGQVDEGRAYVFRGYASGLRAIPAWSDDSNQASASFGNAVAPAGDVNGDGYSDVIVGAWSYDDPQADEGAAFVYHGSPTGVSTTPDWFAAPTQQIGAHFGLVVAGVGDVNGDGYSDVLVGAHNFTNGQNVEGRVYVYHGSPTGLGASPAWTAESNQVGSEFGRTLSAAGDVNGDGYADVAIGAFFYANGQVSEGRVFVYHGSPTGLGATPAWTAESNQPQGRLGMSVGCAGDVNRDGYSDLIAGVRIIVGGGFVEHAWGYYGSPTGLAASPSWDVTADPEFANWLSTAGDVNGDGYSDVIIGAQLLDNGQLAEGAAFAYHGSPAGLGTTPAWRVESNQADAWFGMQVGTAGDVNGDGYSDAIVSTGQWDNTATNTGGAFVYHGGPGGLQTSPTWIGSTNQSLAYFGSSATGAGDVNGDGFADVIVGAPGYDNGQMNEGAAYVYYGNNGDGLDRIARQARVDNTAPIDVLGLSDAPGGFRLKAIGRTPAGRGQVRLEFEVKPYDIPFNGVGIVAGPLSDTGAPGPDGSAVNLGRHPGGLQASTLYHWRVRIGSDSPFFPRSPWLSLPYNAPSEADFRTAGATTALEEEAPVPPAFLRGGIPNPFSSATQLVYVLPDRGRHRIAVYDVGGREVAVLEDGVQPAGSHVVTWDGHDAQGRRLASGTYFVRLELDGRSEVAKVTLAR